MKENYKGRVGKMYITEEAYFSEEFNLIEAFPVLDIKPIRIEYRWDLLSFEIFFTSSFLEDNDEGTLSREYTVIIKELDYGQIIYELSERSPSYEA